MSCPLCRHDGSGPSWLGALRYRGVVYPYVECHACRSLYAKPMPGPEALAQMYGADYAPGSGSAYELMDDPKQPARVAQWLGARPPGLFVDYGCGPGHLLSAAMQVGWRAMGVEYDPGVAASTAARTGAIVADHRTVVRTFEHVKADVLHLGDVIEHLTDPDTEMPRVLSMLKPGGTLLAQGPLEANTTLFTGVLKAVRRWRTSRVSDMPPYHVLLATADGQRRFFERFGLVSVEFSLSEVAWPARSRLEWRDVGAPKVVALFALRRASQLCQAIFQRRLGNRYFFVGRVPEAGVPQA